jgi:hypothetical protein
MCSETAFQEFGAIASRRVKRQRPEPVLEEALAQLLDFFLIGKRLGDSELGEFGIQAGGLGTSRPVFHPGVNDCAVDKSLLNVVAGQKARTPGRPPLLERLRILIPQDERLGPHAVRGGVETRVPLAF